MVYAAAVAAADACSANGICMMIALALLHVQAHAVLPAKAAVGVLLMVLKLQCKS